ncbi:putative transcriptional regulator [Sporosarcina luteola]|nr:putative transcriptional regulator [Sporosarcina luteola]
MDLQKRLQAELLRDANVKLLTALTWGLPVHSLEIAYETVKRTKMDILMKMLLISFRKAPFQTAEEVSGMLLVEPLFIQDMIEAMTRAALITKKETGYSLTDAGHQQLESGIYVQPPEREEQTAYFSPIHDSFLQGEVKQTKSKVFRHANNSWHANEISEEKLREILEHLLDPGEGGYEQCSIHSIQSVTEMDSHSVECLEFRLHHVPNDRMFVRVWNTMTGEWDKVLEQCIIEKDLNDWRKIYKKAGGS